MIAFCAFGDHSIAWLAEDNPMHVSMVFCWIHTSTNPTYVSNQTFTRVIDLDFHLICLYDWVKPICGDIPQEVEHPKRTLMLQLGMVTEEGAVMPHRQDLVLDVEMVVEKRNNMFPSNFSHEERERHILLQ